MSNTAQTLFSINSLCEMPNCVRYNSNQKTLSKAQKNSNIVSKINKKNVRVLRALYPEQKKNLQDHFFYMKGLPSKDFWNI